MCTVKICLVYGRELITVDDYNGPGYCIAGYSQDESKEYYQLIKDMLKKALLTRKLSAI